MVDWAEETLLGEFIGSKRMYTIGWFYPLFLTALAKYERMDPGGQNLSCTAPFYISRNRKVRTECCF